MRILADENIPLIDAFFSAFGEIRRLPGRAIDRATLEDAEVLLVRSVTRVDAGLLEGSRVRFVGTCTIGTDHLDLDYFRQRGIAWASAPGCNARGVVDYVLGSLLSLAERQGVELASRCYGVVGAGQVGGRLVEVLRGLGWRVRVCDPLRQAAEGGDFVDLPTLLGECDVVSLHTPLTREGTHPTWHLFGRERLAQLRPGSWLINASRGAVVDNRALRETLGERRDLQAVLDVWEGEPRVDVALAGLCHIATPHIAGHSLDGKWRGTAQVYRAFCEHLGVPPSVQLDELLPPPWLGEMGLEGGADPAWALAMLCRAVYDPRRDDADFRRSLGGDEQARRAAFDALRKHYPPRREIDGLRVRLAGEAPLLRQMVRALGALPV
ncbi:4-phosphoerythronate dehydrogenase PdxB [Azotobacter beijerinckii]|uniref:4-phosphoerythronate dehydrogenase PdxB n=1 Tax=Azotobacter beijerinckii TaxID=170623 RepID=UPI0029530118|nr:4-phosphoerythronate dehydrogenase PdxB [Azotobacter beijerinckii]MDV7211617.1 4-phosphoerythronate dehydrogenase PdxB [Azotobacter beijerinckii]